jgi:hypothetical protein
MSDDARLKRLGVSLTMILGVTLAALCSPYSAYAACASIDALPGRGAAVTLKPIAFRSVGSTVASLIPVNFEAEPPQHPSIVGLWKFEMLTKSTSTNTNPMPDGTLFDFGTAAWHSDGTELINSGGRDPKDGDFCQGVWTQVGPFTFELLHYPLAWMNGAYTGPVVLRARVTVDRSRDHYGGVFAGTAYLASPTPGHEFDETTPLGTITGTITATRITVD